MTEAVHRVDAEQHGDVQARLLHGEGLDSVVGRRPVATGVAGAARVARVVRNVRAAGQQGANVVADQHRLHGRRVGVTEAAGAARRLRWGGHVVDQDLIHLTNFFTQRHLAQEGIDAISGWP